MQLEKALELIPNLIQKDESFEPIGEIDSSPLPPGARKLEEDGSEVFSYSDIEFFLGFDSLPCFGLIQTFPPPEYSCRQEQANKSKAANIRR